MNKRTPVAIGCPIVSDITDILLTDIYRKEHAKMSQGLLLKNKNGAVLLSDSALTGIDDSGVPFVISKDYEKIWKGKDYVAVHAGLLTYADDVKRTLDDVTKPFSTRVNYSALKYRASRSRAPMNSAYPSFELSTLL